MKRGDVIQAVVSALLFGQDAGIAASDDTPDVYPGGSVILKLTDDARSLLAECQAIARDFEPKAGYGTRHYDLTTLGGDAVESA